MMFVYSVAAIFDLPRCFLRDLEFFYFVYKFLKSQYILANK